MSDFNLGGRGDAAPDDGVPGSRPNVSAPVEGYRQSACAYCAGPFRHGGRVHAGAFCSDACAGAWEDES